MKLGKKHSSQVNFLISCNFSWDGNCQLSKHRAYLFAFRICTCPAVGSLLVARTSFNLIGIPNAQLLWSKNDDLDTDL